MLVKMTWNPSVRQLRQFGACSVAALPLLGWLVLGRTNPTSWDAAQSALFAGFASVSRGQYRRDSRRSI